MALIDIPYIVEMQYATENKEWIKSYGAVRAFEIEEVETSDAPIAIRWKHNDTYNYIRGSNETRWFDNSHWIPIEHHDQETSQYFHLNLPTYQTMIGRDYPITSDLHDFTPPTQEFENKKMKDYFAKKIPELNTWKPVSSSRATNQNMVLNEINKNINDIILIDGYLWAKCPEPILNIDNNKNVVITATRPNIAKPRSLEKHFFRIDRLDNLIEHFKADHNDIEIKNIPEIEILIPDSIHFDDERQQLLQIAQIVLNQTKDKLYLIKYTDAKNWYDLNELYENIENKKSADLEILLSLTENVEHIFRPIIEETNEIREQLNKAKHRWQLAPIDLNSFDF